MENYKEYLEKVLLRYVIATLDNPTQYLISEHFGKYSFTEDVQFATKTTNFNIAQEITDDFCRRTNYTVDVVVIPLKIEYKIIDNTN